MWSLTFLGPYTTQFSGSSGPRRGSTPIATVRQASTQAPRIVSSTQKTSKYLIYDNMKIHPIKMCH